MGSVDQDELQESTIIHRYSNFHFPREIDSTTIYTMTSPQRLVCYVEEYPQRKVIKSKIGT